MVISSRCMRISVKWMTSERPQTPCLAHAPRGLRRDLDRPPIPLLPRKAEAGVRPSLAVRSTLAIYHYKTVTPASSACRNRSKHHRSVMRALCIGSGGGAGGGGSGGGRGGGH